MLIFLDNEVFYFKKYSRNIRFILLTPFFFFIAHEIVFYDESYTEFYHKYLYDLEYEGIFKSIIYRIKILVYYPYSFELFPLYKTPILVDNLYVNLFNSFGFVLYAILSVIAFYIKRVNLSIVLLLIIGLFENLIGSIPFLFSILLLNIFKENYDYK